MSLRTKEAVELLLERDGLKCQLYFCKEPYDFTDPNNPLTIDHVIPRAAGGGDELENLVLSHRRCNNKKADRLYLEDGTLEPLPFREPKSTVVKRDPCETCYEGRLLIDNESCPICGLGPMPAKFPKYRQRTPKECDHFQNFCWSCTLGFTPRKNGMAFEEMRDDERELWTV